MSRTIDRTWGKVELQCDICPQKFEYTGQQPYLTEEQSHDLVRKAIRNGGWFSRQDRGAPKDFCSSICLGEFEKAKQEEQQKKESEAVILYTDNQQVIDFCQNQLVTAQCAMGMFNFKIKLLGDNNEK